MYASALEDAIYKLEEEVSVELAGTPSAIREAQQLRYQVYCLERGYEPAQDGIERDEFDDRAIHAVARWRHTGQVVGTVRVILPRNPPGSNDLPIQRVCEPSVLNGLPRQTIGEVSRFALAKQMKQQVRCMNPMTCSLLRLALIKGAVWLSAEAGHTHWLAVMEPTLLRLLSATGIHFRPLGPAVEYHGLRVPSVAELVPTMERLREERWMTWQYITQGGTWYSAPLAPVAHSRPALEWMSA